MFWDILQFFGGIPLAMRCYFAHSMEWQEADEELTQYEWFCPVCNRLWHYRGIK